MLSKLLLAISLAVAPVVSVSAQVENTFDTFQTADKYLQDFDFLNENSYRISYGVFDNDGFKLSQSGRLHRFYAFPNYYELSFNISYDIYYSNSDYNFYAYAYNIYEMATVIYLDNYQGIEVEMPFLALDYVGMFEVIENDKEIERNKISIYNSFYKFFTGFFPNEVVAEYHGIFTFVIVAFLLFLVFGFVFFLFRVIRRLVGFK